MVVKSSFFGLATNAPNVNVRNNNDHHIEQRMDQPGKVANSAHGQLNRENDYSPVSVRA